MNKYLRLSKHSMIHHRFGYSKYEASMTETQLMMLMGEVLQQLTVTTCITQEWHWCVSSHTPSEKIRWAAASTTLLQPATHRNMWMYSFWVLLVMVQRCDNYMAISPRCVIDFWVSSVTWQWVGPELCGAHGNRHCQAAGWCFPSYYCDIHCIAAFKTFESHDLHQFCCSVVFKSRSRGLLISMCFCPDRLTTWYSSCWLWYGVVHADYLQLYTCVW